MRIASVGEMYHEIGEALPDLKRWLAPALAQSMRRASRFMQFALIGATRCTQDRLLPSDTAVYLASGRGDLEIISDVLQQVFREGQPPRPLSFVNTVSNAACFYIAKALNLEGRSSFVCNPHCAFENTLQLALADLHSGAVRSALVGSVDVVVPPVAAHRRRISAPVDMPLGEGSHWLLLQADATGPRISLEQFACVEEVYPRLRDRAFDPRSTVLSTGPGLTARQVQALREVIMAEHLLQYREGRAYYDTQAAAAVPEFLRLDANAARTLVQVNADPLGRASVLVIER